MKTVQSNANWMEKCAKEMDILLDDDDMYVNARCFEIKCSSKLFKLNLRFYYSRPEKLDDYAKKTQKQTVKRLRAELKHLMSKPIVPLQESLRYPSFSTVQSYLKINGNI